MLVIIIILLIEKASEQLLSQSSERKENHKELLEDLENIQQQAQLIWEKIESSTNRIVQQNAEAAAHFEQTLEKLEKINDTIHFIWNVTESMRTEVEDKLSWITDYIGNTGMFLLISIFIYSINKCINFQENSCKKFIKYQCTLFFYLEL